MGEGFKLFLASVTGGWMVVCVGFFLGLLNPASGPFCATVAFREILKEEALRISRLGLPADLEKKALEDSFQKIREALGTYAPPGIVLDSAAVVSGSVPDVTASVRQHLNPSQGRTP